MAKDKTPKTELPPKAQERPVEKPAKAAKAEAKPAEKPAKPARPALPVPPARLATYYREKVVPELVSKFGYKTSMQVPRIRKITLNMGVG